MEWAIEGERGCGDQKRVGKSQQSDKECDVKKSLLRRGVGKLDSESHRGRTDNRKRRKRHKSKKG